jgi:hypothetical protein
MEQGERELLSGLPEVGYAAGSPGWNAMWQNAVGRSLGRDGSAANHVVEAKQGWLATTLAELTR